MNHALVAVAALGVVWIASADSCSGTADTTSSNVGTFCDHGNRIYDDNTGHGVAVVAKDPTCPQPAER